MTAADPFAARRAAATTPDAKMQLAGALMQAGRADEARSLMDEAAGAGHGRAAMVAGLWSLVGYGGPVAPANAARFLETADLAGESSAALMRATLAASHEGGGADWSEAKARLIDAARRGAARALTALAFCLPAHAPDRPRLLARAAAAGDPAAQFFHGRALLDRDEAEGRRWLAAAAGVGEPCARRLLAQQGWSGGDGGAPAPGHEAAPDFAAAAEAFAPPHLRAIAEPVEQSADPRIGLFENFLDTDECLYLMSRGAPLLRRAEAGGGDARALARAAGLRTNESMKYGLIETDPAILSIHARIARALGEPAENGEGLALLRYRPGERYAPHFDWIDPVDTARRADLARWGQRIKTLVVYLNDDYGAGETAFPRLERAFRGRTGDALAWTNADRGGAGDDRTLHAGVSPSSGEKWLLSLWMRDRSQVGNYA